MLFLVCPVGTRTLSMVEFLQAMKGMGFNMSLKRKYILIMTLIIVTAVVIVICVSIFTQKQATEFDGTLVWNYIRCV